MTLSDWLSLLTICVLGAMSPGPSLAVVLRHSIHSTKHGIVVAMSHGLGVGVYAVLTIVGLSGLLLSSPLLFKGLVYAGALYLLYMGVKALMSKGNPFKADTDSKQPTSYYAAARDGFSIAFLNPKLALFFVALFSQFITPERMNFSSGTVMAGTVLAIDTIWYIIVAGLVHGTRKRFALAEKGSLIDKVAGVVFIALSIRVVTL